MQIEIDENAGFCFGVTNAINKAEAEISNGKQLYCLGEMVHNQEETSRLNNLGMKTLTYSDYNNLHNAVVLLRAHGEPPLTYKIAQKNNIKIIDATCPIVLRLHKIIRENAAAYPDAKTVIFGKKDHAEVVGLVGQVNGDAVVISSPNDTDKIDYSHGILLYSQTTMNSADYDNIAKKIEQTIKQKNVDVMFKKFNTVCRSVAGREKKLEQFATRFDAILFVAGGNSSNGKYLYTSCKNVNKNTYYISSERDFLPEMFKNVEKLGITGATSTPKWLLQRVAEAANQLTVDN